MEEIDIIQISDHSWRIEDKGVRFFLIEGEYNALLIDSGMTVHNAKEIARTLTDRPIEQFFTHADPDHIGSNREFTKFYMHPAEEENYRRNGGTGEIIEVREGDMLDLGGRVLEIIGLPGHTPGSIALLDITNRILISGDPIQYGTIFMFGNHRNMKDYIKSLELLNSYKPRFDEIWPSHGTFPVGVDAIDYVCDCARDIVSGEATGQPIEFHGKRIVRYDFDKTAFLCDK